MKLKLPIVYLVIMCSISFSESVNLLPLESLEINMSVEELKEDIPMQSGVLSRKMTLAL